jgi:hypothetical protein
MIYNNAINVMKTHIRACSDTICTLIVKSLPIMPGVMAEYYEV